MTLAHALPAYAACTSPSGNAGALVYNSDYSVMQYCNGSQWVSMGPPVTGTGGDITTGLVGWWKFDESSGTTAADSSGNGNNGTSSTVGFVAGVINNAYSFDGASSKVDVGVHGVYDNLSALTVSAWIYPRSAGEGSAGMIVHKDTGAAASDPAAGWLFRLNSSNSMQFEVHYATTTLELDAANNLISYNTWHHVVATWDGTSTASSAVKLYIDGIPVATKGAVNGSGARTADSTAGLHIGNSANTARTFDGYIDDVRVYNRVLSATDVSTLYLSSFSCISPSGVAGDMMYNSDYNVMQYCNGYHWVAMGPTVTGSTGDITTGLLAWWKFDDGSGSSAADSSGNGKTGTLVSSPTWTTGQVNGALTFNGTSQYVDSSNFADNLSNFTVAAWFKTTAASSQIVVGKLGSGGSPNGTGWAIFLNSVGEVYGFIQTDGSDYVDMHSSPYAFVNDGNWHQAVMVVTGGGAVALYVDGSSDSVMYPDAGGTVSGYSNTSNVRVGEDYDGEFFNGSIDDVRIYSRPFSASDVKKLYASDLGSGDYASGLVAWWKFDESSGTTAADSSGNGNTATLQAPLASWDASGGVLNGALHANGTDGNTGSDNFSASPSASLNNLGAKTITAWVKVGSDAENDIAVKGNFNGDGFIFRSIYADPVTGNFEYIEYFSGGAFDYGIYGGSYSLGSWVHVAMTYSGGPTGVYTLYINGVSVGSSYGQTTSASGTHVDDSSENFSNKKSNYPNPSADGGEIDDLRIYNRALSPADIYALYSSYGSIVSGSSGSCTSPAGNPGALMYNSDYGVMQYCNGTSWQQIKH